MTVYHNLMRLQPSDVVASKEHAVEVAELIPAAPAPLRRPRSPIANRVEPQRERTQPANFNKQASGDPPRDRIKANCNNNNNKARFVPPDHHPQPVRPRNRPDNQDGRRPPQQTNRNDAEDEMDWGAKKTEQKSAPKPVVAEPILKQADLNVQPLQSFKSETPSTATPSPKTVVNVSEQKTQAKAPPAEVAIVPAQYMVEKLPIGEVFLLSVDFVAADCATKQSGFVCLAMHEKFQDQFNMLLDNICKDEHPYTPPIGSTFAYFEQADEGWYRARRLSAGYCALLDSGRVAPVGTAEQCRALAPAFLDMPEFCCVLNGNVKVNMSLKCTILMKTADGFKVSIDDTEDAYLGEGTVTRWVPEVKIEAPEKVQPRPTPVQSKQEKVQPQPTPVQQRQEPDLPRQELARAREVPQPIQAPNPVQPKQSKIPDVPRPNIVKNGMYMLLDVTSLKRACVRPCDAESIAEFESVLQDAAQCGITGPKKLSEPPIPGQLVLSLFEGALYRALVTRTKATENRYKIQYVEYGNEEIVSLENLFHCPAELNLSSRPARASYVALSDKDPSSLTPPAMLYVETLKEQVELIARTPGGSAEVPSGSLVDLVTAKNKESVCKKLEDMCMPEWKKLQERGGDVIESAVLLYKDMKTLPLPTDRPFEFIITEIGNMEHGLMGGYECGQKLADYIYGPLTDKINDYCNSDLCAEPYLPMVEEVCIAKMEPYPQWFRAVVLEHVAGAAAAAVLYVDYGTVEDRVPVAHLRKCVPDFCEEPALAASVEIQGWPKPITASQLTRAVDFLNLDSEGRGRLRVTRCVRVEEDLAYDVEAPELIAYMMAV